MFGRLTVVESFEKTKSGHIKWLCKCECGVLKPVAASALQQGLTLSCGCLKREKASRKGVRKIKDLTGEQFGRLTVLSRNLDVCTDGRSAYWVCKCQCGHIKTICGSNLTRPNGTKSCGCLAKELSANRCSLARKLPDGEACFNSLLYYYKRNARIRGIKFDLSKDEFRNMVDKPCFYCGAEATNTLASRYTTGNFQYNGIDRIDNSLGYSKSNCVSACKTCNRMKSDMQQSEFFEHILQVANRCGFQYRTAKDFFLD